MIDRGTIRALEIALFGVAFAVGIALSWFALAGEEEAATAGAGSPRPGPVVGSPRPSLPPDIGLPPELPPPDVLPGEGQMVQISGARSNITPAADGCSGRAEFIWEVDPATAPPGNQRAIVLLSGPTEAGEYTRRVKNGEIRFTIELRGFGVWTANVVTVGGRQAFPTPLPVSLTTPGC